jgi:peptide/nickel transport system permease protein
LASLARAARRLLEGLLTAWAAVTLTFLSLRLAAGDPVASLLAQGLATPERAEALRHELGLDQPLAAQYAGYLAGLIRGQLGTSLYTGQPVEVVIGAQLPSTLQLGLASLAVAVGLGALLGTAGAWNRSALAGRLATTVSGLATSLPVATTGVLALLLFGLAVRTAPRGDPAVEVARTGLPALVLGFAASGPFARAIQSGLEGSLQAPFVLAARARGMRRSLRLLWHALRPTLPPAFSLIALEAAFLFSGTVVTETVFSRPGLGRLLIRAILQGDFPIAQGVVGLAALFHVGSQVAADLMAIGLDPRLRRAA